MLGGLVSSVKLPSPMPLLASALEQPLPVRSMLPLQPPEVTLGKR